MRNDVFEFRLPPQAQYLALLRLFFEGLARQLGFPSLQVEQIVMAVDEALANSVRYYETWPPDGDNHYTVRVSVDADALRIAVQDPGSDYSEAFRHDICLEDHLSEMRSSGLGLYIIKTFMDEVAYERDAEDRNELRMTKRYIVNNVFAPAVGGARPDRDRFGI